MTKHNQDGAASSILIILCLSGLLVIALIFGFWAYSGKQHYKNDTEGLIKSAVTTAVAQSTAAQNALFAQKEQYPLNTYNGPEDFGSMVIQYPRTWSGYVDNGSSGSNTFSAYFNPGVVPAVSNQSSVYALTVQVLNQSYSQTVQSLGQSGVTSSVYSLPRLPKIIGVEVSGQVGQNQSDETMVVLPLRSSTLEIATDGTQYLSDFNSIILANFSFSP